MNWLDQNPRKKGGPPWVGLALLVTLIISLLVAGGMNGWWRLLPERGQPPSAEPAAGAAGVDILASSTLPAPATIAPTATSSDKTAPDFTLPALTDESITYRLSDYAGRPVILNFWASWCAPCRIEMPTLQSTYEQYRDEGLVVLGINQTHLDDLKLAQEFVTELGLTFPNVRDSGGDVSNALYRVVGLPTSIFIDAEGEIAHTHIGPLSDSQIDTFSRQLLAGEAIDP